MADNDMNMTKAAKRSYLSRNTLIYRCQRVKEETGLDPCNFYDLVQLVKLVESETDGEITYSPSDRFRKIYDGMDVLDAIGTIMKQLNIEAVVKKKEVETYGPHCD